MYKSLSLHKQSLLLASGEIVGMPVPKRVCGLYMDLRQAKSAQCWGLLQVVHVINKYKLFAAKGDAWKGVKNKEKWGSQM